MLVLDDLHAADAPSLLLLQFLARELGSTRMLVLGAYRDVDPIPGQPLTAMLAEVAREPVTRRLSAARAERGDVAEYVELTAAEIASPELVAALHEETEGNPLFVAETVRLLALEGLHPEAAGARIAIPQSVRDVIARRLAHLSEECNRVLTLASVLGREFALAALARVSGVPEDELLDTLDEAMAARVVSDVPGGPGRLRFAHVLIRDTLYEGLTTARRVRLHRLAVEALEALYGDEPGQHLAELAHHAIAGSDFEKGVATPGAPATGRSRSSPTRRPRASTRQRSTRSSSRVPPTSGRAASFSSRSARRKLGRETARSRRRRSSRPPVIARRLGLSRELARAAAGYGGRIVWARAGATIGSCRCSRKGWPRSARRMSSFGSGFSPDSRERFATSIRGIGATR